MDKERYQRGSHTVTDLKYHFVWKTKYSYGVLRDDVALRVRDIIREICAEKGLQVVKGHIRPNHIHILISAPAYTLPQRLLGIQRGRAPTVCKGSFPACRNDTGGDTRGAADNFCSTVGAVTEEQIQQYIANQSDESGTFKVWDETKSVEDAERKFESDSSENS